MFAPLLLISRGHTMHEPITTNVLFLLLRYEPANEGLAGLERRDCSGRHAPVAEPAVLDFPLAAALFKLQSHACVHDRNVVFSAPRLLVAEEVLVLWIRS